MTTTNRMRRVRAASRFLAAAGVILTGQMRVSAQPLPGNIARTGREPAPERRRTPLLDALEVRLPTDTAARAEVEITRLRTALQRSGTSDPWAGEILFRLAEAQIVAGRKEEAVASFDAASRLPEMGSQPTRLIAAQRRMFTLMTMDRSHWKEGVDACQRLIDMPGPKELKEGMVPNAYMVKAERESAVPEYGPKAAARTYRAFLAQAEKTPTGDWHKNEAAALEGLAGVLTESGQKADALAVYDRYLREHPTADNAAVVAMQRADALHDGPEHVPSSEMKAICEKYPVNNAAGRIVLYQLGETYLFEDRNAEAVEAMMRAYHFQPPKGVDEQYSTPALGLEAAEQAAMALWALKRHADARSLLAEVLEKQPTKELQASIHGLLRQWDKEDPASKKSAPRWLGLFVLTMLFGGYVGSRLIRIRRIVRAREARSVPN